jgi:hypothetical protein
MTSRLLARVTLAAVVSALGVYGMSVSSANTAHATSASTTYTGIRGQIQRVGTVNPLALPAATAQRGQAHPERMPLRLPPKTNGPINGSMPVAAALPLAASRLAHNFDGINAPQSAAVNAFDVEPPDEGLGVGNGYVLNLVNAALGIYRENGTLVTQPISESAFFADAPEFASGTSPVEGDGRVYYDAATNTWFASQLYSDDGSYSGTPGSHIDIAVNPSGNPLTPWTIYRLDTTDANDNGCPCFGDYPEFGIDQSNVYITTNEFAISGPAYNGAQIYAISKSQLEALAHSVNYVQFGNLSIGGAISYHVQPAIAYTNPPAEFFMNSLDPNGTFDHRIGVWAMTNRQAVTTGDGMPYLSSTVINSEAYGFPLNVPTPPGNCGGCPGPTSGVVASDFDAMFEVEYINGHLDSSLDTAITIPGDTGERDGAAWFQVQPKLNGNVISSDTSISNQGYVAAQGNYLLYPHINENASGLMAMAFTLGGPNTYLSAAYSVKPPSAHQFRAVSLAAGGTEPDNGFTGAPQFGGVGRWGDYSNGEVDTAGNIWLATEYIPSNGDQNANWGNRVFEIAPLDPTMAG